MLDLKTNRFIECIQDQLHDLPDKLRRDIITCANRGFDDDQHLMNSVHSWLKDRSLELSVLPGRKRGYATGKEGREQLSELRDQLTQLGVTVPKKANSTGKETKNYGKCPRCKKPNSAHPKDECYAKYFWETKDEIKVGRSTPVELPVPPEMDSLKTQILEKLPDVGSDGSYTIGDIQSAVDFNKKSIGEHGKNPAAPSRRSCSTESARGISNTSLILNK